MSPEIGESGPLRYRAYLVSGFDATGFWAEEAKRLHWYKAPTKIKNTSFAPNNVFVLPGRGDGTFKAAQNSSNGSGAAVLGPIATA